MEAEAPSLFDGDGEGAAAQPGQHQGAFLAPRATLIGSVCELAFFVSGKPAAKGRPRFARKGNYVQTFTPETTVKWEQNVAWQVKEQLLHLQMDGHLKGVQLPFERRVIADLRANIDKPPSYPKRVTAHTKKPDPDNLSKSVLDALETVGVLKGDQLVTDLYVRKRFSEPGHPQGMEVVLTAWLT